MTDASRRDESTDALLRRTLSPGREPETTNACLDGEVAAAWLDGRLHGEALERARTHVADCARCQALMATLVRAEGAAAPVVVALPTPAAVEVAPRRPWWMWAVPVAAAAALVLAVVLIPRQAPQVASAPTTPPAAPATPAPQPTQLADAKNTGEVTPPAEAKAEEQSRLDKKDADAAKLNAKRQAATAHDATTPPKSTANDTKVTAAPPPAAAPPPVAAPAQMREEARVQQAVQAPPLGRDEIGSPDLMIRWRLRRGAVEKSIDGGRNWVAMPTGITGEWTAGAAPTATAFWLVGRGGMVARTSDGRSFERVPFPELTDLSSIQATDAQSATISSKDGHTFTTTDGGRSWARKDLQGNPTAPFNE